MLGLRLVADEPFAFVFDANGTTLRVQTVQELAPARHTVLGWLVPDIVAFERFPGLGQDERGVCAFPAARVAWFRDPDGNTLSLTQPAHP